MSDLPFPYPKPSTPPRELEPMKPEPFKRMQPRGPRWSESNGGTEEYPPYDNGKNRRETSGAA